MKLPSLSVVWLRAPGSRWTEIPDRAEPEGLFTIPESVVCAGAARVKRLQRRRKRLEMLISDLGYAVDSEFRDKFLMDGKFGGMSGSKFAMNGPGHLRLRF